MHLHTFLCKRIGVFFCTERLTSDCRSACHRFAWTDRPVWIDRCLALRVALLHALTDRPGSAAADYCRPAACRTCWDRSDPGVAHPYVPPIGSRIGNVMSNARITPMRRRCNEAFPPSIHANTQNVGAAAGTGGETAVAGLRRESRQAFRS